MVYVYKSKKTITGGAFNEVKKEEELNKQDQKNNITIIKQPITKTMNKLSQEKLNKFVNLKLN